MLERQYQSRLVKRLKSEFPGCIVLKNDANYIQGLSLIHISEPTRRS